DHNLLVTGDKSGLLAIWNIYNGKCICKLESAHSGGITAIVIPEPGTIVTAGFDGWIKIFSLEELSSWDEKNEEKIQSIKISELANPKPQVCEVVMRSPEVLKKKISDIAEEEEELGIINNDLFSITKPQRSMSWNQTIGNRVQSTFNRNEVEITSASSAPSITSPFKRRLPRTWSLRSGDSSSSRSSILNFRYRKDKEIEPSDSVSQVSRKNSKFAEFTETTKMKLGTAANRTGKGFEKLVNAVSIEPRISEILVGGGEALFNLLTLRKNLAKMPSEFIKGDKEMKLKLLKKIKAHESDIYCMTVTKN
ncbi:hypothetical protein HK098_007340, partial [Nowakowskiella sp. JEL0407]